jgi:DNA-binding MarR family transcriptional regulator
MPLPTDPTRGDPAPRDDAEEASPDPAPPGRPAPQAIALHDQPGHLIRRAHQIAVATFHEMLGRDVTPVQYAVLETLQRKPGLDQVTLAQEVALDNSTTADIAVRLEAKGWISRELLARGQRRLMLTDEGSALLATLVPGMAAMQARLFDDMDAHEQAEFMRLLCKFVHLHDGRRAGQPARAVPRTKAAPLIA